MSAARADTGVEGEGCIVTRAGRADLTEPVPPAREPSRRPTPTASRKPVGSCHGARSLGGADPQRPDGGAGGSSTRWRPGQGARHLRRADSPESASTPGWAATHRPARGWGRSDAQPVPVLVLVRADRGTIHFGQGSHIYITIGLEFKHVWPSPSPPSAAECSSDRGCCG